jgi:hypothetical protein
MRLSPFSAMIMAGLLGLPVMHGAVAAPVTSSALQIAPGAANGSVAKIYYYRGRYYPYRYHGAYYPYAYGGHYYNHRYYRYGHWHYY